MLRHIGDVIRESLTRKGIDLIARQPSLWGDELQTAKETDTAKAPIADGPGRWKCPKCKAIVNKHTPECCPDCGQLLDRRALK